jgi:hypothetical protein
VAVRHFALRGIGLGALALAVSGCAMFGGGSSSSHHHRGGTAIGGPDGARPREAEWHPSNAMLLRFDANHDGSVTRAELEAGLKADFAFADKNGDGRLDPAEVRAVNDQRLRDEGSTATPLIDWNRDGFVDFNEFAAAARSLFDQMDTNGDGVLSPAELNPRAKGAGKAPGKSGGRSGHGHGRGGGGGGGSGGGGQPPDDGTPPSGDGQ